MALNQTLAQLRASTRKFANVQGSTAVLRHPDADVNDYVLRALGSLYRKLSESTPDQRWLSSYTVTMSNGTALYALPADFNHLISIDLIANGVKVWLTSFEPNERPRLTDPTQSYTGIPFTYRIEGGNIEFLPTPRSSYVSTLWYVPDAPQPVEGQAFDTISRLDDYIVAYAARLIATKDKQWDLVGECRNVCNELEAEIAAIGRSRDANSPGRILDVTHADRWGRRLRGPKRGWR